MQSLQVRHQMVCDVKRPDGRCSYEINGIMMFSYALTYLMAVGDGIIYTMI